MLQVWYRKKLRCLITKSKYGSFVVGVSTLVSTSELILRNIDVTWNFSAHSYVNKIKIWNPKV